MTGSENLAASKSILWSLSPHAGDYRDCSLSVWTTDKFDLVSTTVTSRPMHDLAWDPHCCNEFATCGVDGAVAFWLLDQTTTQPSDATATKTDSSVTPASTSSNDCLKLNVHETQLPDHIIQRKAKVIFERYTKVSYRIYSVRCSVVVSS